MLPPVRVEITRDALYEPSNECMPVPPTVMWWVNPSLWEKGQFLVIVRGCLVRGLSGGLEKHGDHLCRTLWSSPVRQVGSDSTVDVPSIVPVEWCRLPAIVPVKSLGMGISVGG